MRKLSDWVDFMEGELTPKHIERLSLLLKHSIADQLILDNLRRLRRLIKKTDRAKLALETINEPEFLNQFHNRVMNSIKEVSDKKQSVQHKTLYTNECPIVALETYKS